LKDKALHHGGGFGRRQFSSEQARASSINSQIECGDRSLVT